MSASLTTQSPSSPSPFYGPRPSDSNLSRRRCHLVLISNPAVNHESDFQRIAEYIRQYDPLITTTIVTNRARGLAQMMPKLVYPTLVISLVPLSRFRSPRGRFLTGQDLAKSEEYAYLEKAGIPVPKWQVISSEQDPDLSEYGPYVVTKPNSGGRGALVKIKKKGRVRKASSIAPEGESEGASFTVPTEHELLAQEFVYTGQWPISYRVTTLFGKVLHSLRVEASHERNPLPGPDAFGKLEGSKGVSIVASSKGCHIGLNYEEEIICFGEAAHEAFPDIPLLGVDIVREVPSGKLYVLEVNAIGYIWHFSSKTGQRLQAESNLNLESQFDGLRKAAHILADKTQELAC